jgi:hypothetical protein
MFSNADLRALPAGMILSELPATFFAAALFFFFFRMYIILQIHWKIHGFLTFGLANAHNSSFKKGSL